MSKTEHTPGPWDVKTREEWEGGYDFFSVPDGAFTFMADVEPEDARLIAASPEMLAALKAETAADRAQANYERLCAELGEEDDHTIDDAGQFALELRHAARELRLAAISKAEGN